MCARTREQRKQGFVINKKNVSTAADCLYLDMPTGMKLSEDDDTVPSWNEYPEQDELPRKLMFLAAQILDDRGCIIIQHPGTLRSTQQIADVLDACAQLFKQATSFFVHNETVQYEPTRNMKVHHSKVEVFCKVITEFSFPKYDMEPFDVENSGRDTSMIVNYNGQQAKISKLDDKGRNKCIGFVQTLLEKFTSQGDIVVDFIGGWGSTNMASTNCSRCCIVAETRKDAFECLEHIIKNMEEPNKVPEPTGTPTSTVGQTSRGKKPLNEADDLGDDLLGDEKNLLEDAKLQRKGRHRFQWGGEIPWFTLEDSYRLPKYAEQIASKLAQLPETPRQSSGISDHVKSDRMIFVDDEANEDRGSETSSANTVYLSSHEEMDIRLHRIVFQP
ncbi:hypothetical protein R1sor_008801 [Riccia sorocarpa]|uniref:Uncharacterized protein n=1 Tax=Riccia sorocarpa TaxID=122646 RepID=A0ABD3HYH0_9MARC